MEFYQELLFTAILSVLLVSLLGKLFSAAAAAAADDAGGDRRPSTEIAGEKRGNGSLLSDPISSAEVRSDRDEKREEEIAIEKFDGDLVEREEIAGVRVRGESIMISRGLEAARSTVSEPEPENEAAGTEKSGESVVAAMKRGIGDASVGDMWESKGNEFVEAGELHLAPEKEVDAHGIETGAKAEEASSITIEENVGDDVGAFSGEAIEGADNVVEVKKEEIDNDDSAREMLSSEEGEFLEAGERQLDLTREANVNRTGSELEAEDSVTFVKENEGDGVSGLREEYVPKEGSETLCDVKEKSLLSEEDEWEGIERTELEKHFTVAAAYVDGKGGELALSSLNDDDQMKLYGLHKIVTEGPCYDPQPMALKVAARAKWHSWQTLGNMNPDAAMEQYMSLLSEKIPGWMGENPEGGVVKQESKVTEPSGACMPNLCSNSCSQPDTQTGRKEECPSFFDEEVKHAITEHTDQGFTRAQ